MYLSLLILIFIVFILFIADAIFENNFSITTFLAILIMPIALWFTGGTTVFLFIIPIFVYFIYYLFKNYKSIKIDGKSIFQKDNQYLLLFSLVACLMYYAIDLVSYTQFFKLDFIGMKHPDYIFYAQVSNYIFEYGIETKFLNYLNPTLTDTLPLHYLEIWITGSIHQLSKMNAHTILLMIVFPVFRMIVFLYYYKIARHFSMKHMHSFLLSFTLLFFTSFDLKVLASIPLFENIQYLYSPYNYQKLLIIQSILVYVLYQYIKNKHIKMIELGVLAVCFYTCLPAAFILIFLSILLTFADKSVRLKSIETILALLMVVGVYLFYSYHNAFPMHLFSNVKLSDWSYIKTFINCIGGTILQLVYIFIMPLLVLLLGLKLYKVNKSLFIHSLLFLLPILGTMLVWALIHRAHDSVQVFSNFSITFIITIFSILFLYVFANIEMKWIKISMVLYLVVGMYWNLGKHTLFPVDSYAKVPVPDHERIGFVLDSSVYDNPFANDIYFATPIPEISCYRNNIKYINLSSHYIKTDPHDWQFYRKVNFKKSSDWNQFMESNKSETYERNVLNFSSKNSIKYIFISNKHLNDFRYITNMNMVYKNKNYTLFKII